MREMVRQGHRCLMITSDSNHLTNVPDLESSYLTETMDSVEVCWVRTRKYSGAQSLGRILSWLDFEWRLFRLPKANFPRPDAIIVSSLSLLTIFNGLWLKRRFGCRLIFEVRDIWPLTLVEEGGFSPRNPFVVALGLVERFAYRHADAIVGTMPNLVQHVDEQVVNHAPVSTIPFGIDRDMVQNAIPLPLGWIEDHIPDGKFIVCHAGTIGTTNALDTLFACARDMKDNDKTHFLIVGEGDLRAHYEAACADLPNVSFTGAVPKTMVQSVITHCDVVYFSALKSKIWKYGMSLNKVIDYMLAAKPVIGSYTGHTTMIEEANSGIIVPAADPRALKSAIDILVKMSPDARSAMGMRGREWLLLNRPYAKLAEDYLRVVLPSDISDVSRRVPSSTLYSTT